MREHRIPKREKRKEKGHFSTPNSNVQEVEERYSDEGDCRANGEAKCFEQDSHHTRRTRSPEGSEYEVRAERSTVR